MAGMKMLKPFAEAVTDCFQVGLADYVLWLPISCGPLDKLIVAQGGVDFVHD